MIPSLLTLANGVCGFASVIYASRVHPSVLAVQPEAAEEAIRLVGIAGALIFLGMVFDVLDGHFARLTNAASKFGAELDSLCDTVTFGVAPAFLLLKLGPSADNPMLYKVLFVASTSFVICVILRLARFNLETSPEVESHRFFKGLPSPAAAGCIAAIAFARWELHDNQWPIDINQLSTIIRMVLPFGAIVLAILMVSTVPYPHFVNQMLRGRRSFQHLVQILIVILLIFIFRELSFALAFWGFALMGPIQYLRKKKVVVTPELVNEEALP
jgi:CDP-diacylglycerol--serine O-phosphatidyltransferase